MTPIRHIAVRQLLARRRQALIIVAALSLGVAVLIVTLSLFGGLIESFTDRILEVAPHVSVTAESLAPGGGDLLVEGGVKTAVELERSAAPEERARLRNVMSIVRLLERNFEDRVTVLSPYLQTQALAVYGVNETTLPIRGVIPAREGALSSLKRYLLSGSIARLSATRNGMLIGRRAAKELGVEEGDRIRLVSLSGQVVTVQIIGVYSLGVEASDASALVNLRLAQGLERALPGEATGIALHIADVSRASEVARDIERLTGQKSRTWEEMNAGFLSIFAFLQILFRVVVGFVEVICGFGVANILLTTVSEKQRDIAVMKSFGVSRADVTRIYLLQGVMIALAGSIIGSILGAIGIELMGHIPSGGSGGVGALSNATLQMSWSIWHFVAAIASTSIAGIVAAVAPARSAARLQPIDILRPR